MNFGIDNITTIISEIIKKIAPSKTALVPVGVSNRHIHLSQKDLYYLFGEGYQLTKIKDLKQPNQFAAKETVTVVGPKGVLHNVRILGPARNQTQVEISRTDAFILGVNPPVRISGDTKNSAGVIIIGPKNTLVLQEGVIISANHLHLSAEEAKDLNLTNGQKIIIRSITKERKLYFVDVVVRCGAEHSKEFHI
ncbi:MAG TPA: phosphate propanoyltransferase, partial [bacterium]|nr:phosphate propanoyltransferase [bacterium]